MKSSKQNQPAGITKKNVNINLAQGKQKGSNKVWDFFCSVKLAIAIILIMVIACILGTVVVQQKTLDEYVSRYGYGMATFLRVTQLTDVFHSYWFAFLLLLLCANLICCTIKRWRNTFLQTGFILTHLSIVLILIGGVIKLQFGIKGGVNIYEGSSVNYYLTQLINDKGQIDYIKKDLPFSIALDDFILEKNEPKFQLVSYVKDRDRMEVLNTKVGKRQRIRGSGYRVTIVDYIPDAELKQEPINVSDTPDNPAVFVKLYGSEKELAEGWLLANGRNYYDDRKQNLRVEYVWFPSGQELDRALNSIGKSEARLSVSMPGQGVPQEFLVDLGNMGRVFRIEGTDYTIKMLKYVLTYGDSRPVTEQLPENPAVQVEIGGPEGPETRWIFENFPDWDKMHPSKYKNVKITCTGIANAYIADNTVKILQAPGGKQVIAFVQDKKLIEAIPWEVGKKYSIDDIGKQIMVSDYFPAFDFKSEVIKKSDKVGVPAIYVEVEGPRGKIGDWLFSNSKYATWYPDNNFALIYESTGETIKHYVSKLRIEENGETVVQKDIRVNDPLKYKGYVIYQSSYDPEAGRYTGLQIVKDPGIPVVYSGFGALCFGIVFIFYIKPFLRKKQKKDGEE